MAVFLAHFCHYAFVFCDLFSFQLVKFTQCAVIQWLEDVMCVFTFPTQKMLSEAKIENVPFVSIKQTVGDE